MASAHRTSRTERLEHQMGGKQSAGNSKWKYVFALFAMFVLGVLVAVLIMGARMANKPVSTTTYTPSTATEASEPAENEPESASSTEETTESAEDASTAETSESSSAAQSSSSTETPVSAQTAAAVDIAKTFPSWNPQSQSLTELVTFVQDVCDPQSPNYRKPQDRIAAFDMDGTVISEKAPFYIDYMLLIHRVLDDPNHRSDAQMVAIIEQVRDNAYQGKKDSNLSAARHQALDDEFAGMTPEEYHAYINNFMDTVEVKGFDGMTYGESFYQPMREVIDYLQANEFEVWIVSASEREVVRGVVERLGIEPDHVIGADTSYATTKQGAEAADEYTMGQDEDVVLSVPTVDNCSQTGKVLAIAREIGKRPVLAFGNSSGDYAMLNYAEASGGMACLVLADDETREYGDAQAAEEQSRTVVEESWTPFSMANDWNTIYGEGVTKTELPGAVSNQELASAA